MAQQYDVAARLAEGREALAHIQTYASAGSRSGYRHPDLIGYDGQLSDRYDSEAGLDLRLLDSDCTALAALADVADDALGRQRGRLIEVTAAWRGSGAEVAAEFLRRHCDAGAQLTARLRAAATGYAALRDELWRLVDAKASAVSALDERVGAQRPVWLAAAHAVCSGTADEHAVDVVEKQVIPYVDNDVRGVWASVVQPARDAAEAAYRAAVAAADPSPGTVFAFPGDLGPAPPLEATGPVTPVLPAAVAPVAADVPPADVPPADSGERPASGVPDSAAALDDPSVDPGLPEGLGVPGDLGLPAGGLPGGGTGGLGGLGGLIPRLADALGGPGLGDGFSDPFGDPFEDPAWADDHDPDDPESDPDDPEAEPADDAAEEADGDDPDQAELADDAEPESEAPESAADADEAEPAADTVGTGETDEPAAAPGPPADGPPKTPCEIAAEELPQVGQ